MATTVARLEAILTAQTRDFDRAMNKSEGKMHKVGQVAGVAGLAIAGGLAVGLEKSIHAAIKAQASQARLEQAFKAVGLNAERYEKRIQGVESKSRRLGFTNEDVRTSLGSLITATGNYEQAQKRLAVAEDLARYKHISLEQATKALTMASAGSTRFIKQLGILTPTVTTAQDALKRSSEDLTTVQGRQALAAAKLADKHATIAKAMDIVKEKVHGQAAAFSQTAEGAMAQFHAQLENIEVAIGNKLLPALTKAVQYVMNHWPQISATIKSAWEAIRPTLKAFGELVVSVVGIIRSHWSTIGPIVTQVVAVIRAQLAIVTGVIKLFAAVLRGDWSGAWNALKGIVRGVFNEIRAILTAQKDILFAVMKAVGSAIVHGIAAGAEGAMGFLKDKLFSIFDPGKIKKWILEALHFKSPSPHFVDIGRQIITSIAHGVGAYAGILKDAVFSIAKSIPGKALGVVGGALGAVGGAFGGPSSVKPGKGGSTLGTLLPWAHQEGMTVTSTTGGHHVKGSYHYQGRAIDVSGSPDQMKKFFFDSLSHFGVGQIKELFYDPVHEYVKNGNLIRGSIGGHSDHVHLALGSGGIVTKAMTALIGERGPEAVIPLSSSRGQAALGGGLTVTVHAPGYFGDESALGAAVLDVLQDFQSRNGRPAYGGF